jgi:uncharacterized membrane protein YGL010W
MKTLEQHLSTYALYHRDRRNLATHFVGIPMIVVSVFGLSARPALAMGPLHASPAQVVLALGVAFYLALDLRFGLAMLAVMAPACAIGMWLGTLPTVCWLGTSIALFVVGWIAQFIGHGFEGKKPAFLDDIVGLLIGPLFLMAETAFALHLRPAVREAVEKVAGPTHGGRKEVATAAE